MGEKTSINVMIVKKQQEHQEQQQQQEQLQLFGLLLSLLCLFYFLC